MSEENNIEIEKKKPSKGCLGCLAIIIGLVVVSIILAVIPTAEEKELARIQLLERIRPALELTEAKDFELVSKKLLPSPKLKNRYIVTISSDAKTDKEKAHTVINVAYRFAKELTAFEISVRLINPNKKNEYFAIANYNAYGEKAYKGNKCYNIWEVIVNDKNGMPSTFYKLENKK